MAILKFIKDIELEVVDWENDESIKTHEDTFYAGSKFEVELLDFCPEKIDVKFDDGSVCYCIPTNAVEISED